MNTVPRSILLIDDERDKLASWAQLVRDSVNAEVCEWCPKEDENPSRVFHQKATQDTALVVTEYDLTTAIKGFFGHSVVAWSRRRFIPVGQFARGHGEALSTEPDLFELRVPREESEAVSFIVRMFKGFHQIRDGIERNPRLLSGGGSPAKVLAALLGRPDVESELWPYLSKPGLFNSSLLDAVTGQEAPKPSRAEKTRLLTYILGHMLANAVLKYPGPILGEGPLCAYLAASEENAGELAGLFESARYRGPFDHGKRLFWRDEVDDAIERLARDLGIEDDAYESIGDYHRAVIERALGARAFKHGCDRCGGVKGGFWCPFTKTAVCERGDCSSPASSWVPSGAYACRVERELFDEWVPILGL